MRILASNLSKTTSGAYLISKSQLSRTQQVPSIIMPSILDLPTPDWNILREKTPRSAPRSALEARIERLESALSVAETGIHARNRVIEMDRATMLLQDLHLLKQQEARYFNSLELTQEIRGLQGEAERQRIPFGLRSRPTCSRRARAPQKRTCPIAIDRECRRPECATVLGVRRNAKSAVLSAQ